jgi:hypothetical protein
MRRQFLTQRKLTESLATPAGNRLGGWHPALPPRFLLPNRRDRHEPRDGGAFAAFLAARG